MSVLKQSIRFLHCADLHLDSPFKGLSHVSPRLFEEIQLSTYRAFQRMVDTAIEQQVDFVLMVGDIFDGEQQSMRAHMTLKKGFEELAKRDIDVYLSYGNHDYLNSHTLPRNFSDNVHVFDSEKVTYFPYIKDNQKLANIYGFSYRNREVMENKVSEYQRTDEENIFHIATLHGSYGNEKEDRHAVYAPFQLTELKECRMDYWALGHIHKRSEISKEPPIIYPGNIQGRSRKETGEKGCYIVSLADNQSEFSFIPLQEIRFENISIDGRNLDHIYALSEAVDELVEQTKNKYGKVFLSLELHHMADEWGSERIQEMIDLTNEKFSEESLWAYIFQIKIHRKNNHRLSQLNSKFLMELSHQLQNGDERRLLELWKHQEGSKWLDRLSNEEMNRIREEAEELLQNMLLEGGIDSNAD